MKHVLFDLKQCLITSSLDDEKYVTMRKEWRSQE